MKAGQRRALRASLLQASDYASWTAAAQAHDRATGRDRWKQREASALYDYRAIRLRLDRLRALLAAGDVRGLVFAIEEGVHGNLGGIGKAILYRKARHGTKQLIEDYLATVAEVLRYLAASSEDQFPEALKRDLFDRASHCYGRSALMLSSGGSLVYFHFGVVKALLEQALLPTVISGSSAGALVAAVLGTHSDAELEGFFTPENICFGEPYQPNRFERLTGLRRLFDLASFERTFNRLLPDLTFREAFERSGRQISISVSPCERHHGPRLLNALTSPHVLIRSAVRASCAIPGLFEPVQLLARDATGKTVPYLESRWIDGLFAADLPAKQLARLYGTNHYIVSLINPILLPTFRDEKLKGQRLGPLVQLLKSSARNLLKSSDATLAKYLPASSAGVVNKLLHDILAQQFVGDISIAPGNRLVSPLKLMSPYTLDEIAELMRDGEHQTWPRIEMIRLSSLVSRTLDGIAANHRAASLPRIKPRALRNPRS